jgi:hypothetical protein
MVKYEMNEINQSYNLKIFVPILSLYFFDKVGWQMYALTYVPHFSLF